MGWGDSGRGGGLVEAGSSDPTLLEVWTRMGVLQIRSPTGPPSCPFTALLRPTPPRTHTPGHCLLQASHVQALKVRVVPLRSESIKLCRALPQAQLQLHLVGAVS